MRDSIEYNHFLVMYAVLSKYNKSRLPSELVLDIRDRCDKVRKELRQQKNNMQFGVGTSKSAAKRRARRLLRCFKCGKFSHDGACSRNQTYSNGEFVTLFRQGPLSCYRNKLLNE